MVFWSFECDDTKPKSFNSIWLTCMTHVVRVLRKLCMYLRYTQTKYLFCDIRIPVGNRPRKRQILVKGVRQESLMCSKHASECKKVSYKKEGRRSKVESLICLELSKLPILVILFQSEKVEWGIFLSLSKGVMFDCHQIFFWHDKHAEKVGGKIWLVRHAMTIVKL